MVDVVPGTGGGRPAVSAATPPLPAAGGVRAVSFDAAALDAACFAVLPLEAARRLGAVPVEVRDAEVLVALVDPSDLDAVDALRAALAPRRVALGLADPDQIAAAHARWARLAARGDEDEAAAALAPAEDHTDTDEGRLAGLVARLLDQAVAERASDVHLEPAGDRVAVRFRVDGVLQPREGYPGAIGPGLVNRLKVMASLDIAERRLPQHGRFRLRTDTRTVDCRVVTIPTAAGDGAGGGAEGVVVRLLDQSRHRRTLDAVGFGPTLLAGLRAVFGSPHGMVLVTGPTGSGKTTTLYAALGEVATATRKVIAVEDPVEIHVGDITQVQVNETAGLTFDAALRHFLRADPDVLVVGEIRDAATAALAAEAALTGHLVLSTLHTNDAASAATRLADLGLEGYVASSVLRGVLAQRLVRRVCPACRREQEPDPDQWARRGWPADRPLPETIFAARDGGCGRCAGTGYRDRLAVGELLVVDDDVAAAVAERRPARDIARLAVAAGTVPLAVDALERVAVGATTLAELERVGL